MYYPDLSPFQYSDSATYSRDIVVLNIGWLDKEHGYPRGNVPKEFIEKLWFIWELAYINPKWGYHECELCEDPPPAIKLKHNNKEFSLGAAEIRVVSLTNIVYAAPDLIFHYIIEHSYLPPHEFIEAVMNGPLPSTSAYKSIVKVNSPG